MEQPATNASPARPRYRVRTLLIVTTLAAVVLACLAPWLREVPPHYFLVIPGRLAAIGLGLLTSFGIYRWKYRRALARLAPDEPYIAGRCTRVCKPSTALLTFIIYLLAVATISDIAKLTKLHHPATLATVVESWFSMSSFPYLLVGFCLWYPIGTYRSHNETMRFTNEGLLSQHVLYRWEPGVRFRWQDRDAGQMLLTISMNGQFALLFDQDQIEAAEQLLTKNLPPWH